MKQFIVLLFAVIVGIKAQAQIPIGFSGSDGTQKDFTAWVNTNASAAFSLYTYPVSNGEAGVIEIRYTAVDAAANSKALLITARFKKTSAGVLTVAAPTTFYTNTDAAVTSTNVTVVSSGGNAVIQVTGLAGTIITHSVAVKVSSAIYGQQ